MENNVIFTEAFLNERRKKQRLAEIEQFEKKMPKAYTYDIRNFEAYLEKTYQTPSKDAMYDYLYQSITKEQVKLSTFEKRLAAIKRYLVVECDDTFEGDANYKRELRYLRSLFHEEEHIRQKLMQGKKPVDIDWLREKIATLPTREKAICSVNLVTGNRPNEMVLMRIEDFDFVDHSVAVYMKKQKQYKIKRLNEASIQAVQAYIKEYELKPTDYFVGKIQANKYSRKYVSKQVTETAYLKYLKEWTGLTAYNFRKTLVSDMHVKGADVETIAEQTGHQSLNTIQKHYLTVSNKTVDKFLP